MIAKQRSGGRLKRVECTDAGEPYVLVCGVQADEQGRIVLSP